MQWKYQIQKKQIFFFGKSPFKTHSDIYLRLSSFFKFFPRLAFSLSSLLGSLTVACFAGLFHLCTLFLQIDGQGREERGSAVFLRQPCLHHPAPPSCSFAGLPAPAFTACRLVAPSGVLFHLALFLKRSTFNLGHLSGIEFLKLM